jgi:hypothetical protein
LIAQHLSRFPRELPVASGTFTESRYLSFRRIGNDLT